MPDIIHEINCNLQWRQRQSIYAKQGEYGARKVRIFLYDGANKYNVPSSGLSAVFAYKRPDGFSDSYDAIDGSPAIDLDTDGDYATVTLAQQVLACAGTVECELQLLTADSLIATFTFQISVEASVAPGVEPHSQTTSPIVRSLADIGSGYALCSTAAATAAKEATINGYKLTAGGRVSIRFDNAVPANATLNISNTGAKDIYYHGSKVGGSLIGAGDLVTFVYAGGRYHVAAIDAAASGGGGSVTPEAVVLATGNMTTQQAADTRANIGAGTYSKPEDGISIYDMKQDVQESIHAADTAIQPQTDLKKLGSGIAQSSTQGGTVPKTATLSGFQLTVNGIVAVKFTTPVEASATLNINSTGAKPIYYHGAAITAGIIGYGDTATFVYDGTNYNLLSIDTARPPVNYGTANSGKPVVVGQDGFGTVGDWPAEIIETVSDPMPVLTPVANHMYVCGTVASIQITANFASTGDWMVEFDTPQNVDCAVDLPSALKLATGAPSTFARAKHYEINTHNGYAVIGEF